MIPFLFPQIAVSTPSIPNTPVSYIQIIKPLAKQPDWDRDVIVPLKKVQAQEAVAQAQLEAAQAAEAQRLADIAAQQAQAAYTAPVQPVAPIVSSGGDVPALIVKWANYYGVDPNWLLRVASCESGYRPGAVNLGYWAGGGNPSGVFQFLPATFASYSAQAGFSGNIFNADDNIHAAAYAFAHGGSGDWECR